MIRFIYKVTNYCHKAIQNMQKSVRAVVLLKANDIGGVVQN